MVKFSLQARQFGRTLAADIIKAPNRDSAIKKFKKKHFVSRGYAIYAQKIQPKKIVRRK